MPLNYAKMCRLQFIQLKKKNAEVIIILVIRFVKTINERDENKLLLFNCKYRGFYLFLFFILFILYTSK